MKIKITLILAITILNNLVVFSQNNADTSIVVIDSLYFQSYVICEDIVERTRCSDTIYSIMTFEDIKTGFLSFIDNTIKKQREEVLELNKFKEKHIHFERTHLCRSLYKGFEFPLQSSIYIKLMYMNSNCDSIPIMEGEFYQNQKYEFYYSGNYKEYDKNGRIKSEGYYYFTKEGERKISIPKKGVVEYGKIPRKYSKEEYGGTYIKAKKDGIWKYYLNGKLTKTETFKKGIKVKN